MSPHRTTYQAYPILCPFIMIAATAIWMLLPISCDNLPEPTTARAPAFRGPYLHAVGHDQNSVIYAVIESNEFREESASDLPPTLALYRLNLETLLSEKIHDEIPAIFEETASNGRFMASADRANGKVEILDLESSSRIAVTEFEGNIGRFFFIGDSLVFDECVDYRECFIVIASPPLYEAMSIPFEGLAYTLDDELSVLVSYQREDENFRDDSGVVSSYMEDIATRERQIIRRDIVVPEVRTPWYYDGAYYLEEWGYYQCAFGGGISSYVRPVSAQGIEMRPILDFGGDKRVLDFANGRFLVERETPGNCLGCDEHVLLEIQTLSGDINRITSYPDFLFNSVTRRKNGVFFVDEDRVFWRTKTDNRYDVFVLYDITTGTTQTIDVLLEIGAVAPDSLQ